MSGLRAFLLVLGAAIGLVFWLLWRWFGTGIRRWARARSGDLGEIQAGEAIPPGLPAPIYPPAIDLPGKMGKLSAALFTSAVIVYLMTRLIGVESFPIYFFGDEAAQTVLAADLVRDGFRHEGVFLPTYFYNVDKYSLGVTVYLQVVPYLLFGKSILVTRATAVFAAALGAVAVGLLLCKLFGYPHGWTGVLLLGLSPAWFIHARTAFETPVAVAFYGVFLYAYLRYLYGSPRYIPLAGIAGALAFYSYNPARIVVLATLGLLAIVDFRTHWANRRTLFKVRLVGSPDRPLPAFSGSAPVCRDRPSLLVEFLLGPTDFTAG